MDKIDIDAMRCLYIIRGIPGSGKTTFAEEMAIKDDAGKWPVHSADDYFMIDGEYKWDSTKIGAAHQDCKDRTEKEMIKGTSKIFVANTFTTNREIKPYQELAEKYGYKFTTVIVENRHGNESVHNVPKETIFKMETRLLNNIKLS